MHYAQQHIRTAHSLWPSESVLDVDKSAAWQQQCPVAAGVLSNSVSTMGKPVHAMLCKMSLCAVHRASGACRLLWQHVCHVEQCVQTCGIMRVTQRGACRLLRRHVCHAGGCVQTVLAACISCIGVRVDWLWRHACRLLWRHACHVANDAAAVQQTRVAVMHHHLVCCDAPPPGAGMGQTLGTCVQITSSG